MNIFVLDVIPRIAAQYHCDKHVVKMILESTQILSTVIQKQFPNTELYKATHINHPCTIWAGNSKQNFQWLYNLTIALGHEYTKRYGKIHKSINVATNCYTYIEKLQFKKKN